MTRVTEEQILDALKTIVEGDKDIVSLGMVSGLQIKDGHVALAIAVDPDCGPQMEPLRKEAEKVVHGLPGVISATVVLTAERQAPSAGGGAPAAPQAPPQAGAQQAPLMPGVSAIVAVASGKGGVGKSTVAVNLALGLAAGGHAVGVLDADIYGPSMPRMLGIAGKPVSTDGRRLEAMENFGVKCMSMGFLVDEETPTIWRGPMVMSALQQMMRDVNWGALDVMIVDLPPGTGDAQLTMAQQVPLAGAVIVSTPQDIALLDARKGLNMFRQVDVPVFGIIENMSYFACPHCGERSEIFSHGGARREAERLGMDFLGEIPLDIAIRETSDSGRPIVVSQPDSAQAKTYRAIADRVWEKVSQILAARETSMPKIVVQ
ncbi:MAG: Mrp/NBP35 family ATP-binding protein [Rhodospirillales bacterium]